MYILILLNLLVLNNVQGVDVVDVKSEITTEFPTEPPVEMMKVRERKFLIRYFPTLFLSATNVTQNKAPAVTKSLEWLETVQR